MLGFTYNGIHSSKYNVWCVPDASARWIRSPEFDVYAEDVSWHNGGYYFGNAVKTRTFDIKCFYEEIDIATRENIRRWLHRSTEGKLMFDDMPFVYWIVRPTKPVAGEMYLDTGETYSGTFTVTFTAYEPFGYLTRKFNRSSDRDNASDYCGLIAQAKMPAAPDRTASSFDVYNPGTEVCGLRLKLRGHTSNPIMFLNNANKTSCIISDLPAPASSMMLDIDADYGKVTVYPISTTNMTDNGFAYHDRGYIRLEPSELEENVQFSYEGRNGTLYIFALTGIAMDDELIGAMIKFSANPDLKAYVVDIDHTNNMALCSLEGGSTPPSSGLCDLYKLNHIEIFEKNSGGTWGARSSLVLNQLLIDYVPRVL